MDKMPFLVDKLTFAALETVGGGSKFAALEA